ncbi:Cytoskeleton-associated protein 2-like Radial fiber and mitotic spindle protein [Larimichthys crocea]|uniref:Cytoskeleton-associated protein 2-like Radial fiber and mitotic spindle protein n=1 Tax=Larimichthys crocea TaxID=215358 RepID=A0A6G0IK91_LARCR|nr:Cytoskeleton-associated protein 2-like Radial fiber and mitotic spindle protein [Larimichthys crocea]
MEEGEAVSTLSRKELRKQKLMEYLAAKGKMKQPNSRPYLRDDCQVKNPVKSAPKIVTGKENKVPADRISSDHRKVPTLVAQSTIHLTRRVFATNKILTGKQNGNRPSAVNGATQPVPTETYTAASSKSNLTAASQLKTQPNTKRGFSHAPSTTKSDTRFSSRSHAALSYPQTVSYRMSLGPIVKTKTGLVPAVTQPMNSQSQKLTQPSALVADATTASSVSNKMRSNTSSVSVSKRSAMAPRKTLPTTALNNPVKERTTVLLTAKVVTKDSKPLSAKHPLTSCKSQLSNRLSSLKSTPSSSRCTAAPIKPEGKVVMSKTIRSAWQPMDRTTKIRSQGEREKNGRSKVAPRTSLAPASRCSSSMAGGVIQADVVAGGGKIKSSKETGRKKVINSANAAPPQTDIKRTVMSQTVPRDARIVSHRSHATDMKTPRVPVSIISRNEGKKATAVQEERMRKLQEWREAKGISYKRPPMPVKPQVRRTVAVPQPFWATMNEEDEAQSLICAVDRSLADCIKLLGEGCPPDQVREVLSRLPAVSQKFAKYWICQARLKEQEGNLDVLPMFEEAVSVVLEPVDELRTVVFEILKKKDEIQENEKEEDQIQTAKSTPGSINSPMMTPKPVRAFICGEKGDTSVVKYKITATPGGPPSQQKQPTRINGQEIRFFTPVRRSVRIQRASLRYPASLQDHDLCVASYNDLISEEDKERSEEKDGETSPSADNTPMYVYRQNEALKDKVFVQLVCNDNVSP